MKSILLFVLIICKAAIQTVATAQIPSITSFSPTSGTVGTIVTIQGSGFDASAANNIVMLGAVKAEIITASSTQLTARVPVGASSVTPLIITNLTSQKTVSSLTKQPSFFTVTYPGGK